MLTRRQFLKLGAAGVAGLAVPWNVALPQIAHASVQAPQTTIPGSGIPQFVEPLPVFGPAGSIPRVTGPDITVSMHEIQQKVLPESFYSGLAAAYQAGTWVWAYQVGNTIPLYPGITVEAKRGVPTTMTYINSLPVTGSKVQQYITVDQSVHWANPSGVPMMVKNSSGQMVGNSAYYNADPPAVVHLHGAEVSSYYDGGPDQWFTPSGKQGAGYRTLSAVPANQAVYQYLNGQDATTLWFHDHTLGATRLNVYAGMAAFYLLRDQFDTGVAGRGLNLPAGAQEIEIVIQDRQFDANGQLVFPDSVAAMGLNGGPLNPAIHPYWNPEFFGDVVVVNGKSWPYLEVEPRRYRFRLLDGCNARILELRLENRAKKTPGPAFWVIGSDGGLLNAPVMLNDPKAPGGKAPRLLIAPGERYDLIIDFKGYEGQTLTLINSAKGPYPEGMTSDPGTTGQIMQFRVTKPLSSKDTSFNPAVLGVTLRAGTGQPYQIADLKTATPTAKRRLTLNEVMGPGGPVELLVNNSKWNGKQDDEDETPISSDHDDQGNYLTELPKVGTTELWEIVNLTGDTHPIHLHLVQFQLISRQAFNVNKYQGLYDSLFPGGAYGGVIGTDPATATWGMVTYPKGVFIPAYGPPLGYMTDTGGYLGGNPDVTPYLQGPVNPPQPEEAGWKDTVKMHPGEVARIMVRFTRQDGSAYSASVTTPDGTSPGFDATDGPGYVWHCHIVDHEDNEMMRPYHPVS